MAHLPVPIKRDTIANKARVKPKVKKKMTTSRFLVRIVKIVRIVKTVEMTLLTIVMDKSPRMISS